MTKLNQGLFRIAPVKSPEAWSFRRLNDVTEMIARIQSGDRRAGDELFTAVYNELRAMAARHLEGEKPGQTLQPTALVHEAWMRMSRGQASDPKPAGEASGQVWSGRRHFFGAASEAMRRILVDRARGKNRQKRDSGGKVQTDWNLDLLAETPPDEQLEALDEALNKLATVDPAAAELVRLRYFAGLTMAESAEVLQQSLRGVERLWTYAKAWLRREIEAAAS